nr:GAF domain-containing protein [Thiorhodococcus minor]
MNRIDAVLSGIKGAIVRERDPESLYRAACRVAVDVGGFKLAWIGLLDPESSRIEPIAHAGAAGDYLAHLSISLADAERAHGPTGLAILRGRHAVCKAIASDSQMLPWRDAALARGFRASAAFPIWVAGTLRRVFSLCADHEGFFDTEALRLLDDLTADLGVALELIEATAELRAQRDILDRTDHLAQVGG